MPIYTVAILVFFIYTIVKVTSYWTFHTEQNLYLFFSLQILFKNNKNEEEEEEEEFMKSDYYKDYIKQKKRQEEKKLGKTEDSSAAQKLAETKEKIFEGKQPPETATTTTPESPDNEQTESDKCSQSEVKKVVTFDIPEKAEKNERKEEDCSSSTDTGSGDVGGVKGDGQTKEEIDPRKFFKTGN